MGRKVKVRYLNYVQQCTSPHIISFWCEDFISLKLNQNNSLIILRSKKLIKRPMVYSWNMSFLLLSAYILINKVEFNPSLMSRMTLKPQMQIHKILFMIVNRNNNKTSQMLFCFFSHLICIRLASKSLFKYYFNLY